jgi:hypothetical protein
LSSGFLALPAKSEESGKLPSTNPAKLQFPLGQITLVRPSRFKNPTPRCIPMFSLLPEMTWFLLMLGAIIATIVAAVKEKKARAAAAQYLQPAPMMEMGGDDALGSFGNDDSDQFNMDSFK